MSTFSQVLNGSGPANSLLRAVKPDDAMLLIHV
jgi:hypothetical protein